MRCDDDGWVRRTRVLPRFLKRLGKVCSLTGQRGTRQVPAAAASPCHDWWGGSHWCKQTLHSAHCGSSHWCRSSSGLNRQSGTEGSAHTAECLVYSQVHCAMCSPTSGGWVKVQTHCLHSVHFTPNARGAKQHFLISSPIFTSASLYGSFWHMR